VVIHCYRRYRRCVPTPNLLVLLLDMATGGVVRANRSQSKKDLHQKPDTKVKEAFVKVCVCKSPVTYVGVSTRDKKIGKEEGEVFGRAVSVKMRVALIVNEMIEKRVGRLGGFELIGDELLI